jgi:hypothetical protein
MSPETTGIVGIAVLLFLFLLRMPVGFAMALVGVVGFAYLSGFESALALLAQDIYETFSAYPLSVIPLFILMGSFAFASGISERLYRTTHTWVGSYRGGLTIATVLACSGFAAISGSTAATAATMGKIALPEMRKYKYDNTLATGCDSYSAQYGPDRLWDSGGGVHRKAFYRRRASGDTPQSGFYCHGGLAVFPQTRTWPSRPVDYMERKDQGNRRDRRSGHSFFPDHRRVVSGMVQPHPGGRHRRRGCTDHRPGQKKIELESLF